MTINRTFTDNSRLSKLVLIWIIMSFKILMYRRVYNIVTAFKDDVIVGIPVLQSWGKDGFWHRSIFKADAKMDSDILQSCWKDWFACPSKLMDSDIHQIWCKDGFWHPSKLMPRWICTSFKADGFLHSFLTSIKSDVKMDSNILQSWCIDVFWHPSKLMYRCILTSFKADV